MKKVALLFLLVILSLQFFIKGGYVVYYHLNKSYISSTFCVNKDKPMSTCQGKCYLAKKIKQQEQQSSQMPDVIKNVKDFLLFVESLPQLIIEKINMQIQNVVASYTISYKNLFVDSLLQPPQ
jgi:hypothetical protein